LYKSRDFAENDKLIEGLIAQGWKFSVDEKWVLPDEQKGLSFSAHWQH
jgi:hypothetical protein